MLTTPTELAAGARVGRLRLVRPLGEGSLAKVYLAEHEVLGSQHAVKFLSVPGAKLAERLVREGRIQASLRHPNVVTVTDVVEVDGMIGLVMEFVDGWDLQQHLHDNGTLGVDEAIHLFGQVLDGVSAAHGAGVLHRDINPGNVLLQQTARGLIAKVTDFGIAKVDGPSRTGRAMGTPGYMAPEQIENDADVDVRADIFSLGALLYHMLAGTPPFAGVDLAAVMERTVNGRYAPLDSLGLRIPAELARTVDRCLQSLAHDRFATCEALGHALGRVEAPTSEIPVVIDHLEASTDKHFVEASWVNEMAPDIGPDGMLIPDVEQDEDLDATVELTPVDEAAASGCLSNRAGRTSVLSTQRSNRSSHHKLAPPSGDRPATPVPLAAIRARAAARSDPDRTASTPAQASPSKQGLLQGGKRNPERKRRVGLWSGIALASCLAGLIGSGAWLHHTSTEISRTELALQADQASLVDAILGASDLTDQLIAQGAPSGALEAKRAALQPQAGSDVSQDAAMDLLEAMETAHRELPADPAADPDRAAIDARMQELGELARRRDEGIETAKALRALPGASLAQDLGLVSPAI